MSATLTESTALAEEVRRDDADTFATMVRRLSHQSVDKHFDAYADIDWDSQEFRIDPSDPRWELSAEDRFGGTAWYRSQPQDVSARIGLHLYRHVHEDRRAVRRHSEARPAGIRGRSAERLARVPLRCITR